MSSHCKENSLSRATAQQRVPGGAKVAAGHSPYDAVSRFYVLDMMRFGH